MIQSILLSPLTDAMVGKGFRPVHWIGHEVDMWSHPVLQSIGSKPNPYGEELRTLCTGCNTPHPQTNKQQKKLILSLLNFLPF